MRKGLWVKGITWVILAISLSGCGNSGKADRDEIADDLNIQESTASGSDADSAVIDGAEDIPEHISYSVKSGYSSEIKVDADVDASGYAYAAIYDVKPVTVDEEVLKSYADKLFDNGSYEVVKPYSICSMDELQAEKELLEEIYEGYEEEGKLDVIPHHIMINLAMVEKYMNEYDESNVRELGEDELIVEEEMEDIIGSGQSFVGDETVETVFSCRLRGECDGAKWELCYRKTGIGNDIAAVIMMYPMSGKQADTQIVNTEDTAAIIYGENYADLETSKRSAMDFMEALGYEGMEIVDTSQLVYQHKVNDKYENYIDGYRFTFARALNGIQTGYMVNSAICSSIDGSKIGQEYIKVYVDEDEIEQITISRLLDVGDKMSECGSMLSFEQIDMIAQEFMEEKVGTHEMVGYSINDVSLRYVVLPFEDGRYSMMPVWIYYVDGSGMGAMGDNIYASFGVNAVDGSIVEFLYDETIYIYIRYKNYAFSY